MPENPTVSEPQVHQQDQQPAIPADFPPELQALIEAWPTLSGAVKAGIAAMVKASK